MTKKTLICSTCGKEFEVPLKSYNYRIHHFKDYYCCKECRNHRREQSKVRAKCSTCGKDIIVSTTRLSRSKSGRLYCSRHCATIYNNQLKAGIKHANYVGGNSSYRATAFRKYSHKCAICGWDEDENILQVHHIDENRNHNQVDNLIILCPNCHAKLTSKLYELSCDKKEIKKKYL